MMHESLAIMLMTRFAVDCPSGSDYGPSMQFWRSLSLVIEPTPQVSSLTFSRPGNVDRWPHSFLEVPGTPDRLTLTFPAQLQVAR